MDFRKLFETRKLWTIAIYKLTAESEILRLDQHAPVRFVGERGFRRNTDYQALVADPFLFVHGDRLYLFYEVQTDFGVGEIWAESMAVGGHWSSHGRVLKEDFHLSYPQVFKHDGKLWMIPEAASSGKVWLYAADSFPHGWRKSTVLIDEPLVDTSIVIREEGIFLLGTTRAHELKIYFSTDLRQPFESIGRVICRDMEIARNAGSPLVVDNTLYRVAQDCSARYGKKISLLRIETLSIADYSEQLAMADLYRTRPNWMHCGYHHITTAKFDGSQFVAVDGVRNDRYLNTLSLALLKTVRASQDVQPGARS